MSVETFLDGRVTMLVGDVRAMLKTLPDNYYDCVPVSPPYWGLRSYLPDGHEDKHFEIGLEPTLGEHLTVMVEVFEEVKRVLKPTGTLWLNYGDCYATSPNGRSAADTKRAGPIYSADHENGDRRGQSGNKGSEGQATHTGRIVSGGTLKPKDLCMVPNRLAIALQEAGWWVRSEIIWGKPNPMPNSSGKYRPSTAHEKIFMLAKSAKCFYDAEAVALPVSAATNARVSQAVEKQIGSTRANGGGKTNGNMKAVVRKQDGHSRRHDGFNDRCFGRKVAEAGSGVRNNVSMDESLAIMPDTRYLRNYEPAFLEAWNIGTSPFSEAHFATFPPELAARCIKAGCPEGGEVLDIFGGAGTSALVAAMLGRKATLIELNPEYATLARARIEAAFMGKEEGARHMGKQLGKDRAPFEAGSLFASAGGDS
jgi:DNA modification methylase